MIAKRILLSAILLCSTNVSFSEVCKIQGSKVSKYAYKNGFSFSSESTGDTSCRMSSHKAGGSAATKTNGMCIFKLFFGKKLTPPWVFSDISYAGKKFTIVSTPNDGDSLLSVRVKLTPGTNGTATFLVSQISLKGDDCDNWKSAF